MILHQLLLALGFLNAQAGIQAQPHFPPKPQESSIGPDFIAWHGWAYMNGAPAALPRMYPTSGDWSEVQARYAAVKPVKPAVWHLKVVIFTRIESEARDANGVLRERRATIESVQLGQVKEALSRFQAYVAAKFSGAVSIEPDIQIEAEWMRDSGTDAFGSKFAHDYFEPRINGGSYEAEDRVFRGPFNSALYILPGTTPVKIADTTVNDTPIAAVPTAAMDSSGITENFDSELRMAWDRQVEIRGIEQGYKSVSFSTSQADANDPWPTLTSIDEVMPQVYLSRLATNLEVHSAIADPAEMKVSQLAATEAKIAADQERGQVLKFTEVSGYREGGIALPSRFDNMPIAKIDTSPTLSFWVKSSAKDPIAIRLDSSDGKTAWISVGQDPLLVTPMPGAVVESVPFVSDAKWQKIAVDLRPVAKLAGMADVAYLAIEPTPNAKLAGKVQPEPTIYLFDEFKFSADAPGPILGPVVPKSNSDDPEARALFAAQAKSPSPELAALLNDKSQLVRLNATSAYIALKDPSVEPQLISNSLDLDPSVAAAALTALQAEGSDVARAIVKRSVSVGLSDYAKATAGRLLAATKDPKVADNISYLSANRSWQAHVAAVEALAEIHTPESQIFRKAFIGMTDPAVKLAVTRYADPSIEEIARALLWSAVNEPSDMVRAESYIKLIQAAAPANKAEGYKGVRDDSRFVREVVVKYLTSHPSEDHRNALRLAVADRSAKVRAAALEGFAALEQGTTLEEIANVLDDQDPNVQLALIDLSKKKALKLPQKTLDAMQASPDTKVSAAAKAVG